MNSTTNNRRAFTLTELMVSILIISILASVTLYAMASVQTQAKIQNTKARISKIHELLIERWESYEDRILRLSFPPAMPEPVRAQVRLGALRELIKMEMPDRVSDVTNSLSGDRPAFSGPRGVPRPTLHRYYLRYAASRASGMASERGFNFGGNRVWSYRNQGAECLYLFLSRIEVADESAVEMFSESEIGDTDGDGMLEVLDAWGRPLNFVRWAPGFPSPMQRYDADLDGDIDANDAIASKDAFDYAEVDPRTVDANTVSDWSQTFALVPLLFSSGPDGDANILRDVTSRNHETVIYRLTGDHTEGKDYNDEWNASSTARIPNDPYVFVTPLPPLPPDPIQLGEVIDINSDGHVDNIYNHLIETSTN